MNKFFGGVYGSQNGPKVLSPAFGAERLWRGCQIGSHLKFFLRICKYANCLSFHMLKSGQSLNQNVFILPLWLPFLWIHFVLPKVYKKTRNVVHFFNYYFFSNLLQNCFLCWDHGNGDVTPKLDAALLCSSRVGSDLGLLFGSNHFHFDRTKASH